MYLSKREINQIDSVEETPHFNNENKHSSGFFKEQ